MMVNRHKRKGSGFSIFLILLPLLAHAAESASPEVPRYEPKFRPLDGGEQAFYRAKWNGIPVATADIRMDSLWIGEKKYYRVEVKARTLTVLDLFWKMRDTVVSVFEAETLSPHRYVLNQRENRKKIDTVAVFDARQGWRIESRRGSKIKTHEFASADTLDPVTAVYFARSLDFKLGDRLHFNVFGGKSRYLVTLHVAGHESIKLESGTHDAFKIIPYVKNITKEGYAERLRETAVWISADRHRMLLKMTSKIIFGTVYLEKVEQLDQAELPTHKS